MLRRTPPSHYKQASVKGKIGLMGRIGAQSKVTASMVRLMSRDTQTGDLVAGRGQKIIKAATALTDDFTQHQYPLVWIHYPWRRAPEPPTGTTLPCPNALKNLHGAVVASLTPKEQKLQAQLGDADTNARIPASRAAAHARRHPFLDHVMRRAIDVKKHAVTGKDVSAAAVGFPFWFKLYPTRRHAYEYRFNIPKEMVLAYPREMQQALSATNFSVQEQRAAEKARYIEKYAENDLDTTSPAVAASMVALRCRSIRNHLLSNPHNNLAKFALAASERTLAKQLRRLRKIDFRKYWQIISDHDIQDLIQPHNKVSYRWGKYWSYDWESGLGISTNIADFMDPRGMNGCVETGRSRAEVARDLGLSYTRVLQPNEKKHFADTAMYRERMTRQRIENPEAWRLRGRQQFIKKFTGMFTSMNWKARVVDFPSRFRGVIGTKINRWKSARHGPM